MRMNASSSLGCKSSLVVSLIKKLSRIERLKESRRSVY